MDTRKLKKNCINFALNQMCLVELIASIEIKVIGTWLWCDVFI